MKMGEVGGLVKIVAVYSGKGGNWGMKVMGVELVQRYFIGGLGL